MAICDVCKTEMVGGPGCSLAEYDDIPGGPYPRIPVGDPRDFEPGTDRRCHDCAAPPGTYHHPGCDAERCPRCGYQAISCGCCSNDGGDP